MPFFEGRLFLKCEVITYEKQGEVLTERLRDGMHKIFLRTSRRQYTSAAGEVNINKRGLKACIAGTYKRTVEPRQYQQQAKIMKLLFYFPI
jgi:hypothetical protein